MNVATTTTTSRKTKGPSARTRARTRSARPPEFPRLTELSPMTRHQLNASAV